MDTTDIDSVIKKHNLSIQNFKKYDSILVSISIQKSKHGLSNSKIKYLSNLKDSLTNLYQNATDVFIKTNNIFDPTDLKYLSICFQNRINLIAYNYLSNGTKTINARDSLMAINFSMLNDLFNKESKNKSICGDFTKCYKDCKYWRLYYLC